MYVNFINIQHFSFVFETVHAYLALGKYAPTSVKAAVHKLPDRIHFRAIVFEIG